MSIIHHAVSLPRLRRNTQRGIGLIESVLSLIVVALLMLILWQWIKSSSDDLRAKRNADSLQQFTQVAGHYLDANRETIMRIMNAESVASEKTEAQSFCVLNNDTTKPAFDPYLPSSGTHGKGTCAVDAQWLIHKNLLPSGFSLTNPYGQSWVVIYRLVYADYDNTPATPDTTQWDVEMLVAATGGTATPNSELGMTVQLMGGVAGMLPEPAGAPVASCPQTTTPQICGPSGWTVDVSKFQFTYY